MIHAYLLKWPCSYSFPLCLVTECWIEFSVVYSRNGSFIQRMAFQAWDCRRDSVSAHLWVLSAAPPTPKQEGDGSVGLVSSLMGRQGDANVALGTVLPAGRPCPPGWPRPPMGGGWRPRKDRGPQVHTSPSPPALLCVLPLRTDSSMSSQGPWLCRHGHPKSAPPWVRTVRSGQPSPFAAGYLSSSRNMMVSSGLVSKFTQDRLLKGEKKIYHLGNLFIYTISCSKIVKSHIY